MLEFRSGLYSCTVSSVWSEGRTSLFFPVDSGVRKWCVLPCTLFNTCMDRMLGRVLWSGRLREERFSNLGFAMML